MTSSRSVIARIAISIGALAVILYLIRDKLGHSLEIIRTDVDWHWFVVAIGFYILAQCVLGLRLKFVFQVQSVKIDIKESIYLNFLGLFFNLFLPSAVGGDIAKAYFAYKYSGKKLESTTSVILDRLMGFTALITMAMIAVLFFGKQLNNPQIDKLIFLFLGIMIVTMLFFASKRFARIFKFILHAIPSEKWKDRLERLYKVIHTYRSHKQILGITLILSLLGQCFFIMVHYFLALSLGIQMNIWLFFVLVPVISIVCMAPSMGGLGVREAGMIYFFKAFMPLERAIAFSMLNDLLVYGFSIFCGLWFALKGGLKAKLIHDMEKIE